MVEPPGAVVTSHRRWFAQSRSAQAGVVSESLKKTHGRAVRREPRPRRRRRPCERCV